MATLRRIKTMDRLDEYDKISIYPFFTLRPEKFGALLFNYRTCKELPLDPVEAYITSLCDGCHTAAQIKFKVHTRFGLSDNECERYVLDTLAILARILAVGPIDKSTLIRPVRTKSYDIEKTCLLSAPKTVYWEVTHICNLRCRHCLTSSGPPSKNELNTEQALSVIDQLANANVFQLIVTGGEPFMRPDILHIIRGLLSKKICVKVDTNGLLLNDSLIRKLSEMRLRYVQVSIDGMGKCHDDFRGKKGAFETACHNIERLLDKGMKVNILTTVTSRNIHELDRIIDLAASMGCNGLFANPFIPVGRGRRHAELRLSLDDYYEMHSTLIRRSEELKKKLVLLSETDYSYINKPMRRKTPKDGPMGCSAGNNSLTIGADGTAYPCPFLHDFPLGNLLERPLKEIWSNHPVLETLRYLHKKEMNGECQKCRYAPDGCAGGCRARAYYEHGDLKAPDPACILPIFKKKEI